MPLLEIELTTLILSENYCAAWGEKYAESTGGDFGELSSP